MDQVIKDFFNLEKGAKISMDDWEQLKLWLSRVSERLDAYKDSRDEWRRKYEELKYNLKGK